MVIEVNVPARTWLDGEGSVAMIGPLTSASFVALGRLTSLVLSPDGSRLIVVRQESG
jgi:hypothetical protein